MSTRSSMRVDEPPLVAPSRVAPWFLVRVAGLPRRAMEDLAHPETARILESCLEDEAWLAEHRTAVVDALGACIPKLEPNERAVLLRVRRCVHNTRTSSPIDLEATRPLIPAADWDALSLFADRLELLRERLALVDAVLERELQSSRGKLRDWAREPEFHDGLLVASPTLLTAVGRYLFSLGTDRPQKMRLAEEGLIRYLARAATKTSPFSYFTSIGTGDWKSFGEFFEHEGDSSRLARIPRAQIGVGWLMAFVRSLATVPATRQRLPVRLNEALWRNGDRWLFLRRKPSNRSGGIAMNSESVVSIASSPVLEQVLRRLGSPDSEIVRVEELALALEHEGVDPAAAHGLLAKLEEIGLLEVGIRFPAGLEDPWEQGEVQLREVGTPEADKGVAIFQRLREIATAFGSASPQQRAVLQSQLTETRRECIALMDPSLVDQPDTVGRQLLFEDTVIRGRFKARRDSWEPLLDDLVRATMVPLLYDEMAINQYDIAAEYRTVHGPDKVFSNYLEFFHEFHLPRIRRQMGARGEPSGMHSALGRHPNPHGSEAIEAINVMRHELAGMLTVKGDASRGAVAIAEDDLRSWAERYPYPYLESMSAGYFCMVRRQALDRAAPLSVVVNMCGPGYGKYASRFAWQLDGESVHGGHEKFSETVRATNRASCPSNTVLAECGGYFGAYGVESHPPLTDYEIVYPGEGSVRPAHEQIHLCNVSVVYNEATRLLELRDSRLNQAVWPLHLGFLTSMLTPPLFRSLIEFSPPLAHGVQLAAGWTRGSAQGIDYFRSPRVTAGRVVLKREQWAIHTEQVPFALSPVEFWRWLKRLQRALGLPRHVFRKSELYAQTAAERIRELSDLARQVNGTVVEKNATPEEARRAVPENAYRDEARKPSFLDFDSLHFVSAFQKSRALQGAKIYFIEAMPDADDLLLESDGDGFVSEFLVEVSGRRRW